MSLKPSASIWHKIASKPDSYDSIPINQRPHDPRAMLATKIQLSAPLGMTGSQATAPTYHVGPSHKSSMGASSQDGMLFTSPTESEFSLKDGHDAVRWVFSTTRSVLEGLRRRLIATFPGRGMRNK